MPLCCRGREVLRWAASWLTSAVRPIRSDRKKGHSSTQRGLGAASTRGAFGKVGHKSQPLSRRPREPDPTHNELKHTITRKTATHERNQTHLTFTRTHNTSRHTPSATPTRERTRQGNHRLRDLHRPLRQRLRPLPPLLLHLPLPPNSRPTSSSWRRVRPANCDWRYRCRAISRTAMTPMPMRRR